MPAALSTDAVNTVAPTSASAVDPAGLCYSPNTVKRLNVAFFAVAWYRSRVSSADRVEEGRTREKRAQTSREKAPQQVPGNGPLR